MKFSGTFDPSTLSVTARQRVVNFFVNALRGERGSWPLPNGTVAIYTDNGRLLRVFSGDWQIGDDYVYVGQGDGRHAIGEEVKLGILMAMLDVTGMANEPGMKELVVDRLAKVLVGTYEGVVKGLIRSKRRVEKIAFSKEMGVAGWYPEEDGQEAGWYRMSGEPVVVDEGDNRWTIVESTSMLPPRREVAGETVTPEVIAEGYEEISF